MKFPFVGIANLALALYFAFSALAQDGNYLPASAEMNSAVVSKLPKPVYPAALTNAHPKP